MRLLWKSDASPWQCQTELANAASKHWGRGLDNDLESWKLKKWLKEKKKPDYLPRVKSESLGKNARGRAGVDDFRIEY